MGTGEASAFGGRREARFVNEREIRDEPSKAAPTEFAAEKRRHRSCLLQLC